MFSFQYKDDELTIEWFVCTASWTYVTKCGQRVFIQYGH